MPGAASGRRSQTSEEDHREEEPSGPFGDLRPFGPSLCRGTCRRPPARNAAENEIAAANSAFSSASLRRTRRPIHGGHLHVLTRTDRYTLDSFAASATARPGALFGDWPGDQIGRWFSVLHVAQGLGWTPAAAERKAVADVVLPLQTKDGNFGKPGSLTSDDIRIPSGNAFALRGLMDAYSDTHDPRYLDAARRLARYFEAIAPKWEKAQGGKLDEFYGHCLDGLVALYEEGGDQWRSI